MNNKVNDLSGKRVGRLTVTDVYEIRRTGLKNKTYWKCKCDCGEVKYLRSDALSLSKIKSCGCINKMGMSGKYSHGQTKTKLYQKWSDIRQRCNNINNCNYHKYGARGIEMCKEWESNFLNFMEWAYKANYNETLTIDRIDNNGNYTPSNCKWSTNKEQQQNKRTTVYLTLGDKTMNVGKWSVYFGTSRGYIGALVRRGKTADFILNKYNIL